jgi:ribosome biogenesis SPOUT family RNA methylase Rps3
MTRQAKKSQAKKSLMFIIEHLEPELWPWCLIEYKHISKIVKKDNLWFTNIKKKDFWKLNKYGKVSSNSIKELSLEDACVLDQEAKKTLTPKRAKEFNYFIFGGILGNHPPQKRTREKLTLFLSSLPSFNIGKEQMSTDNAIFVVKQITEGKHLASIKFTDNIEIKINSAQSTVLPYRYALVKGKPLISKWLISYLRKH